MNEQAQALHEIKCTLDHLVNEVGELKADRRLAEKDFEYMRGRILKAEADIQLGEQARLQTSKSNTSHYERVQNTLAEIQSDAKTARTVRTFLRGAFGIIIALLAGWIAHSGLFGH